MAQAGFYHQPSSTGDDRAMCFTCNVCLVCWEPTDEPWYVLSFLLHCQSHSYVKRRCWQIFRTNLMWHPLIILWNVIFVFDLTRYKIDKLYWIWNSQILGTHLIISSILIIPNTFVLLSLWWCSSLTEITFYPVILSTDLEIRLINHIQTTLIPNCV